LPRQAEHAEPRAQEVAEHAGQPAIRRKEPEEAWMLPVRKPRHDDAIEIDQDLIK
jgi:hypothetical protein